MSDTTLPVTEYIKQGVFAIIIIAIAIFGIKSCRKYQKKRAIVIELTSHASESAAYEQFYAKDAKATLLKAMHQLHLAAELGHIPSEIMEDVMDESSTFLDDDDSNKLSLRKQLIKDSLLSNYENCIKLGIFTDPSNLTNLEKGELPIIKSGPSTDEEAAVVMIIPPYVLDGVDKLIPNLVISPPVPKKDDKVIRRLNEFEIARAKKFTKSLVEAKLIERDSYKKITEYIEKVNAPELEPDE